MEKNVEFTPEISLEEKNFLSRLSAVTNFSLIDFLKKNRFARTTEQAHIIILVASITLFVCAFFIIFFFVADTRFNKQSRYYVPDNVKFVLPPEIQEKIKNN